MPAVQHGDWEGQASRAKAMIAQAEARLRTANAAYSEMRSRGYPRGNAAAQVTAERRAAERALNDASDYLAKIKKAADDAGQPL